MSEQAEFKTYIPGELASLKVHVVFQKYTVMQVGKKHYKENKSTSKRLKGKQANHISYKRASQFTVSEELNDTKSKEIW